MGASESAVVRLLPDGLINKIAAGEVVERPASVVKELVENSIDAGAGRVDVHVEEGGRGLIAVIDDGIGMEREDALMALERHATSKLRVDEDLFRISSLGFRGEALPSIAEVSRFELRTGPQGSEVGTRLSLDGGVWGAIEDAPNPGGTEIRVRSLFFNTPVRLKFLKTPRTEMHHVLDVVQRMALSHPEMATSLRSGGRVLLDVPKGQTLRERVRGVLGKATAAGMVDVAARQGSLRLEGLVSGPSLHRSSRGGLFLFVNGRFVRDRTFIGALLSVYRDRLPKGRYPMAVLFLDLPPEDVDVNVHPAKVEVRWTDGPEIWRFVASALGELLDRLASGGHQQEGLFGGVAAGPASLVRDSGPEQAPTEPPTPTSVLDLEPAAVDVDDEPRFRDPRQLRAERAIAAAQPGAVASAPVSVRLDPFGFASAPSEPGSPPKLGTDIEERVAHRGAGGRASAQLLREGSLQGRHGPWLLWSASSGLVLVDAAAAHRRLVFSNLRQGGSQARVRSRRVLVPELFEVDEKLVPRVDALTDQLAWRGLEIGDFGGGTLALHAGPEGLGTMRLRWSVELWLEWLQTLKGGDGPMLYRLDALLSWYAAPSATDYIAPDVAVALVQALSTAELATVCPFGEPVLAHLEDGALLGSFSRRST